MNKHELPELLGGLSEELREAIEAYTKKYGALCYEAGFKSHASMNEEQALLTFMSGYDHAQKDAEQAAALQSTKGESDEQG